MYVPERPKGFVFFTSFSIYDLKFFKCKINIFTSTYFYTKNMLFFIKKTSKTKICNIFETQFFLLRFFNS